MCWRILYLIPDTFAVVFSTTCNAFLKGRPVDQYLQFFLSLWVGSLSRQLRSSATRPTGWSPQQWMSRVFPALSRKAGEMVRRTHQVSTHWAELGASVFYPLKEELQVRLCVTSFWSQPIGFDRSCRLKQDLFPQLFHGMPDQATGCNKFVTSIPWPSEKLFSNP